VEANLRLVGAFGAAPVARAPRLPISTEAAQHAEALLRAHGLAPDAPRVGFHCFTVSPLRTWPAERFARVIERLRAEAGAEALLLGAPAEATAASALAGQVEGGVLSLVGQTTLKELAAVLSRLDLLVCLDSGLLHMAAAVGTPTVSLFGPGEPARWRPLAGEHTILWRALPCSPCRDVRCIYPTNRCMQEIGVEEVVAAARRHLVACVNRAVTTHRGPA
jgi:ADP-heptose:LPS heptosyltransferase